MTDRTHPIYLTPGRCSSCAKFVAKAAPPACWKVKPAEGYRQIPDDPYNYFARTRCADRGRTDGHIWIPVDITEVEKRDAEVRQQETQAFSGWIKGDAP